MQDHDSGETAVEQADEQPYYAPRDLAVPADESEGYLHVGVDPACDPIEGEGYWIPVAEEHVEREHVPKGHVVQFPKDDREPERRGPKDVPDHVHNWDYRDDYPEWLPDEYDPDASLLDRLPVLDEIDAGIELHVQGEKGTVEVVHRPQHYHENPRYIRLCCGPKPGDWGWEIVAPKKEGAEPRLEKVDPQQDVEAYEATKRTWLKDVDVRIYGIDLDRFEEVA